MKQLLELSQEYILEAKFRSNQVKTENGYKSDWIDDKKEKANGRNVIESISVLIPVYDREGYGTSTFQKVFIPKEDIIKLSKRIEEIELVQLVGTVGEDLPF